MRIDHTTFGVEPPDNSKPGRTGQTGSTEIVAGDAAAGSGAGVDQASFSFNQGQLQSLQAQVLAQPEIRDNKVQALQQAIGQGDYSVPPSQIADAMVNDLAS
jgi:flagellar biosynthesis anti-sigma factor FlgM